ncbi:hypothetical protein ACFWBC_05080 [Streptomyces sp. NPDC059985]|uniref:hypothetical protein n=1 Tax=Streptomyces sp. NPDC059985 TaxID=3347025 RepID=UPI0036AF1525
MGRRAAGAMAAAGWTVEEELADAHFATGRRDRVVIRVRPEPLRSACTLDAGYVLCYECDGLGWCSSCYGRTWVPDAERGRRRCSECHEERFCPICRGAGQKYASTLQYYERGYYPELFGD